MTARTKQELYDRFSSGGSATNAISQIEQEFEDLIDSIGVTGSITVAASDASNASKGRADYQCDGTADDVQINAALVEANAAGGGRVVLSEGEFAISANVLPLDYTSLEGMGYGTLLTIAAAKEIWVNGKQGVTIRNLRTDSSSHTSDYAAFRIQDSSDARVTDCHVTNCGGFGIYVIAFSGNTTQRVWVTNNYIEGTGVQDCIGGGTDSDGDSVVLDIFIENNVVAQIEGDNDNAIDMVRVHRVTFRGNKAYGNVVFGDEQFPNQYSIIESNIIENCTGQTYAILWVITSATATSSMTYVSIVGNVLKNAIILLKGVAAAYVVYAEIIGNMIDATGGPQGIDLDYVGRCIISENIIANSTSGITWDACNLLRVTNNIISDVTNGIIANNAEANNVVENNTFATVTTPVTGTATVRNNYGYVTENDGTSAIASGQTTKVVAHGCAATPTVVNIAFREQGTNDYGRWWVSAIGSTGYTLNVSGDPGASNLDFGWEAKVR